MKSGRSLTGWPSKPSLPDWNYKQRPKPGAVFISNHLLHSVLGRTIYKGKEEHEMTYTIWSNGGRYEWIIREGEFIINRSGMIFTSYAAAKRAMLKAYTPDACRK